MKYEAHITVEPVALSTPEGELEQWNIFCALVNGADWRVSKFDHDEVDGIAGKWFLTYGSDHRDIIMMRTYAAHEGLVSRGYTVLRWKVEETVYDSKAGADIDELRSIGA